MENNNVIPIKKKRSRNGIIKEMKKLTQTYKKGTSEDGLISEMTKLINEYKKSYAKDTDDSFIKQMNNLINEYRFSYFIEQKNKLTGECEKAYPKDMLISEMNNLTEEYQDTMLRNRLITEIDRLIEDEEIRRKFKIIKDELKTSSLQQIISSVESSYHKDCIVVNIQQTEQEERVKYNVKNNVIANWKVGDESKEYLLISFFINKQMNNKLSKKIIQFPNKSEK